MPVAPPVAFALFVICWWLALFCVLPIGVKSLEESGESAPSHDQGAPAAHGLRRKALWATGLGAVVWIGVMAALAYARR